MNLENLAETKAAGVRAREQEQLQEQGATVGLQFVLPDGSTVGHQFLSGVTVAYVKLCIEKQHGHPVAQQILKAAGKTLMDPMCLCDYNLANDATVVVQLN